MRFPRYPFVAISPVSPRTPELVDVTCSSCGMIHVAVGSQAALQRAAEHRDLHLVVALATATISAAGAALVAYVVWLLHLSPAAVGAAGVTAGAVIGAAGGMAIAVRLLSPARRTARQAARGRGDA